MHWRKAALNDRVAADCLLAVAQVAEELELPSWPISSPSASGCSDGSWITPCRETPVSEADYPAHMAQPVPAEEVGALMRGRDWQWTACAREFRPPDIFRAEGGREGPPADLREADETCRNLLTLRAHMLVRHQFGSEIDWHLRLFDDVESTVSLGHMPFIRNLAAAYVETGEERYAFHAARLLWSFYRVSPVPNHRQPQGPWRTLEVGNRQCTAIPDVLGCLGMTEPFDEALHSMLARSRLEHMRFLLAHSGGAGNWYQVECAGLAAAAQYCPSCACRRLPAGGAPPAALDQLLCLP